MSPNLVISDELLADAREHAESRGIALSDLVEEGIRMVLSAAQNDSCPPTFGTGTGGVYTDLKSNEAIFLKSRPLEVIVTLPSSKELINQRQPDSYFEIPENGEEDCRLNLYSNGPWMVEINGGSSISYNTPATVHIPRGSSVWWINDAIGLGYSCPEAQITLPTAIPQPTLAPAPTATPRPPEATPTPDWMSLDTDNDGLTGYEEQQHGTDPNNSDTDSDGLLDGHEVQIGTDPTSWDTDQGGINDGVEVNQDKTNPLDPRDDKVPTPVPTNTPVPPTPTSTPVPPTPTSTPEATATPIPTATPTATPTPEATPTPVPTNTPEATATVTEIKEPAQIEKDISENEKSDNGMESVGLFGGAILLGLLALAATRRWWLPIFVKRRKEEEQ